MNRYLTYKVDFVNRLIELRTTISYKIRKDDGIEGYDKGGL